VVNPDSRKLLLGLYAAALRSVDGQIVVRDYLQRRPMHEEVYLVAIGKAAASMARGAQEALGPQVVQGLVITKKGYAEEGLPFGCIQSDHPVPDENSLEAGKRLLAFIDTAPPSAFFLFLISGGTSSLVESLPEGFDLKMLREMNRWLLASGLDIGMMNMVRKRFSCLKGGRLAERLQGRSTLNLMISDVVDDDPAVIGSGLLAPSIDDGSLLFERLPVWLREKADLAPSPPSTEASCFDSIENQIVANCQMAIQGAAEAGKAAGLDVYSHSHLFQGDVLQLAHHFAQEVQQGPPGLYVWGGESTIKLPPFPGRGGRNQSLALAAARFLAGDDSVLLLVAGTDGTDGPTRDAGALVDGGTIARGSQQGMDAVERLVHADAGSFLEASGDLIRTGPTGTNVMDLVLALKDK